MRTASNVMLKHFLFSFDMRLPYHLAETLITLTFTLVVHSCRPLGTTFTLRLATIAKKLA